MVIAVGRSARALAIAAMLLASCNGEPDPMDRAGLHNDPALRLAVLRQAACVGPVGIRALFDPSTLSEKDAAVLKRLAGDASTGDLRATVGYEALRRLTGLGSVALFPLKRAAGGANRVAVPSDGMARDAGQAVRVIVDLGGATAKDAAEEVLGALPTGAVWELLAASRQLILRIKASAVAGLAEIPVVCAVHADEALRPITMPGRWNEK